MRKSKFAILLGAAILPLMSVSTVFAAHPGFGSWSATGGTIGGTCPTGYTCIPVASGDGFLQERVFQPGPGGVIPNTYFIRTVVTPQGASGDAATIGMYSESFVQVTNSQGGNGAQPNAVGIAARQAMSDASTGVDFSSNTDINTGWAAAENPGVGNVVINQTMDNGNAPGSGSQFVATFDYASNNDANTGDRTGFTMDIMQDVGLLDTSTTPATGDASDDQMFVLSQRQGDMLTGGGNITLPGQNAGDPNQSISYTNGDSLKGIWLGQQILGTDAEFFPGSNFAFNSYEVIPAGATAGSTIRYFQTTNSNPQGWPADLLPLPTMPTQPAL